MGLDTNDASAGRLKMFLIQFGGEVLTAYRRKSVTLGRHLERTIANGKAAKFPVMGRKNANYLFPGENLDDKRTPEAQTEVLISIDGLLTSDSLINDLDEAMQHYDVRSEYTAQMGEALALAADGGLLAEIAKLVVADKELLAGLGKGKIITREVTKGLQTESEELGLAITSMLLEASTALDNNYVPDEGRVCYVKPVVANALVASKMAIDRNFGAVASIVEGNVTRIAGFDLVKVPHLTRGGITSTANGTPEGLIQGTGHVFPTTYKDTCAFLIAHKNTVGTLTLKSFQLEHGRRIEYQSDQIVAKYAMGHGGLRPEGAFMGVVTVKA